MSLFVLGPFSADRVALDGNAMVSGLPAPTALAGLSDALARRLGQPAANWPIGLILHDLQLHAGRAKPKPIYKQHKVIPDEAIERLTGWLRATVVVNDPQDTVTAEEVAASLGITGSTLLHHLRASQRKLLEAFYDEHDDTGV